MTMAYNFAAGNKRLSGNLKGYNEEKAKEHSAKSKALGKKGRDIDLIRDNKRLQKKYPHAKI